MSEIISITGNLVEEVFCKPFDKFVGKKIEKDAMEIFLHISMADDAKIAEIRKDIEGKVWYSKVLTQRSELLGRKIDDKVFCFLLSEQIDRVGSSVMWAHYLAYKAKEFNVDSISWDDFCMRVVPDGLPSKEHEHKCWDGQKGYVHDLDGVDNILDMSKASKSLILEK